MRPGEGSLPGLPGVPLDPGQKPAGRRRPPRCDGLGDRLAGPEDGPRLRRSR